MTLPSKGWGPWRQEFYSLHSNPDAVEADTKREFGTWQNVHTQRVGSFVFEHWPSAWRRWANLPLNRGRTIRRLGKFFPNLR